MLFPVKLLRFLALATIVIIVHGLLTGCRTARPAPVVQADAAPATAMLARRDTTARPPDSVVVLPHRSLLDKALRRTPARAHGQLAQLGRIGKKAIITIYNAPATITNAGKKAQVLAAGATVQARKSGAVLRADSGATLDYAVAKNQAAAGRDIGQTMPAPPPKRGFLAGLGAGIGGWLVPIMAAWALAAALWFGWPLLLAWFRRRKSPPVA